MPGTGAGGILRYAAGAWGVLGKGSGESFIWGLK